MYGRPTDGFSGKCVDCGRDVRLNFTPRDTRQVRCSDCHRRAQEGSSRGGGPLSLPQDYLRQGYFDQRGNLRPEIIVSSAQEVAQAFYRAQVTTSALRRFFGKSKFIQQRLEAGAGFEEVRSEIYSLMRDAANAAGRARELEILKQFVDANAQLAVADRKNFDGFLEHFESVVAYFKYFSPNR